MPIKSYLDDLVTVQQMKQHVDDGLTDAEIAEKYLVSPNTVYRFRAKHGIQKHRTKSVRDIGMYYRLKECLLTDEQVAYVWNMSRRSLTEWKKREGLDGVAKQNVDVLHDGTPVFEVIMRTQRGENPTGSTH